VPRTRNEAQRAGASAAPARVSLSSSAERVAAILRGKVVDGVLLPGARLSEERLGEALGVSRNTLREAFRLLAHDQLVVHEHNRGVFVRTLTAHDIRDLYSLRRVLEAAAARHADPVRLGPVRAAVERGEAAAAHRDWSAVATADLQFHQHLVGLCASPRLDDLMHRSMAELRLVFHRMHAAAAFHGPYLQRNRQILTLLEQGEGEAAEKELMGYLDDAEAELLTSAPSPP